MLEIRSLNKTYGKKVVLNNINLSLNDGVYGFVGPNGAGKTTLFKSILLLNNNNQKNIYYNNKLASKNKLYLNDVGYLPQNFGLFADLSVGDALKLLANFKEMSPKIINKRIDECLKLVNMRDHYNDKMKTLSGGMIRRIGIAQAMLNNPKILILDEPTVGLDPEERIRFRNIISNISKNRIILISTHIINDIEDVCNKVIVMDNGEIKETCHIENLKKYAEGKVFELPYLDLPSINGDYYIEKKITVDGIDMVRVLTSEKQRFEPCIPNIEDGYICLTKTI